MIGWIGVDLDGTLAHYDKWEGPTHIGEPVVAMARRVEAWLDRGIPVRILTARVWTDGSPQRSAEAQAAYNAVAEWTKRHFGVVLPVTCVKDPFMIEMWDDRAVTVKRNSGEVVQADQFI